MNNLHSPIENLSSEKEQFLNIVIVLLLIILALAIRYYYFMPINAFDITISDFVNTFQYDGTIVLRLQNYSQTIKIEDNNFKKLFYRNISDKKREELAMGFIYEYFNGKYLNQLNVYIDCITGEDVYDEGKIKEYVVNMYKLLDELDREKVFFSEDLSKKYNRFKQLYDDIETMRVHDDMFIFRINNYGIFTKNYINSCKVFKLNGDTLKNVFIKVVSDLCIGDCNKLLNVINEFKNINYNLHYEVSINCLIFSGNIMLYKHLLEKNEKTDLNKFIEIMESNFHILNKDAQHIIGELKNAMKPQIKSEINEGGLKIIFYEFGQSKWCNVSIDGCAIADRFKEVIRLSKVDFSGAGYSKEFRDCDSIENLKEQLSLMYDKDEIMNEFNWLRFEDGEKAKNRLSSQLACLLLLMEYIGQKDIEELLLSYVRKF